MKPPRPTFLTAGLLALLLLATADPASPPARADEFLLRAAQVVPVSHPTLTNAAVRVRDGRIVAIESPPAEPGSAMVIDLPAARLYPGLIAPVTPLGLIEIEAVRATRDVSDVGDYRPDLYAWVGVNPDSELIPVARAAGYTHAQAVPAGGLVSGHSAVLVLDGWTIEDLAIRRAAALHVVWPSFHLDTTPRELAPVPARWKSPEDQTRDRERRLRELDTFFDEAEAYARRRAAEVERAPLVPAWEAMLPALRGEIPIFVQATEFRQIRSAVDWLERRRYRGVLAGARDAWRLAERLAAARIPVVWDDTFTLPHREEDAYDVHFAAPAVLARAGVTVAFGGGLDRFGGSNLRNVPYAAAQSAAFGLSSEMAIRGLTLNAAQVLGLADRLGSLEPGKEATLIATDGDLLDIRSRVTRMWIAGREVSLESRHTRLYERYRQRPRPTPAP